MQQAEQQGERTRTYGRPFEKGRSPNASGRTVGQKVHDSLLTAFRSTHHREPNAIEALNLRTASKLAAKVQSPNADAEVATRCANALSRLLTSLGLHTKRPARPKSSPLADIMARQR